jgi:hypothetical protein
MRPRADHCGEDEPLECQPGPTYSANKGTIAAFTFEGVVRQLPMLTVSVWPGTSKDAPGRLLAAHPIRGDELRALRERYTGNRQPRSGGYIRRLEIAEAGSPPLAELSMLDQ